MNTILINTNDYFSIIDTLTLIFYTPFLQNNFFSNNVHLLQFYRSLDSLCAL